jgi:hypothetical protein
MVPCPWLCWIATNPNKELDFVVYEFPKVLKLVRRPRDGNGRALRGHGIAAKRKTPPGEVLAHKGVTGRHGHHARAHAALSSQSVETSVVLAQRYSTAESVAPPESAVKRPGRFSGRQENIGCIRREANYF